MISSHIYAMRSSGLTRFAAMLAVVLVFLFVGSLLVTNQVSAASPPVFEPLGDVYLSEGQTVSVTVRVADADGDSLSLATIERPIGSIFSDNGDGTANFSWTSEYLGPLSSAGSPFTVMFVASDGISLSSETLVVHVQNMNRSPIITLVDSVFVEVGDTVNIQPTVFDPDQDKVTWSMATAPTGLLLRNADGPAPADLQWAPETADSGSNTIVLTATDQWGLSVSASATVVVSVGAPFSVTIAVDTAFPGEVVSIPVLLKNRKSISGFEFELHYDPSVMAFISIFNETARTSDFESLTFQLGAPSPGDLKVVGIANTSSPNGAGVIPAGDGTLFTVNFFVSSENNLAGLFLPVIFGFGPFAPPASNTLTDTTGSVIVSDSIVFTSGGVKIVNQSDITRGDINLNGVPFEVADALRFTNYFIDPAGSGFNAEQFANSDVNSDGIVASIADLVTLLSIVLGDGAANPRITPGYSTEINVLFERQENQAVIRFNSNNEYETSAPTVGAALLTFVTQTDGILQSLKLGEGTLPNGYEVKLRQSGDTLRALIYKDVTNSRALSENLTSLPEVLFVSANTNVDFEKLELVAIELASTQGGTLQANLVKSGSAVLPTAFELEQNYPNPFNPTTEIRYSLSNQANVKLVIYDILGRTVRTLVQGTFESGDYVARWDGADEQGSTVASGMYFYRLTANGYAQSRKMTLLK